MTEEPPENSVEQPSPDQRGRKRITRRRFLLAAGLTAVGVAAGGGVEAETLFTSRHRAILPGMGPEFKPFRVAQLSDLHRSYCVSEGMIRRAAGMAMAERPDIVLLTGDFITRSHDYMPSCAEALRTLRAPLGVWAVLGNHDYKKGTADRVIRELERIGCRLLVNANARLANGVWLAGIDDASGGVPDRERTHRGVPDGAALLTMAHNPRLFDELSGRPGIVFSGHTHGGQTTSFGAYWQRGKNANGGYVAGWYRKGAASLYVNRGIGVVGPPIRLFSPPEVSIFDLIPEKT